LVILDYFPLGYSILSYYKKKLYVFLNFGLYSIIIP
jgi:hypothetical protein